jgi:hypothetical protein
MSAYVRYVFHDRYIVVVLEVSLSLKCGTLLTLRLGPIIHTTVVTAESQCYPGCLGVATLDFFVTTESQDISFNVPS